MSSAFSLTISTAQSGKSGSNIPSTQNTIGGTASNGSKSGLGHLLSVWAGYTVNSSEYSIQNISASWKVPPVECNSSSDEPQFESSLVWIDGFFDGSSISSGTVAYCPAFGSTAYYFADYQVTPASASFVEIGCLVSGFSCNSEHGVGSIHPGDVVSDSISVNSSNSGCTTQGCNYLIHFTDYNNSKSGGNYTASIPQSIPRLYIPRERLACQTPDSSTSVVVDTVTVSGVDEPLAHFSAAYFGAEYTKIKATSEANSSGTFYPIGKLPGSVYNDTMILDGYPYGGASPPNVVMSQPSVLTDKSSSFYVTWVQAGPFSE